MFCYLQRQTHGGMNAKLLKWEFTSYIKDGGHMCPLLAQITEELSTGRMSD